jgi:hypothetical protein
MKKAGLFRATEGFFPDLTCSWNDLRLLSAHGLKPVVIGITPLRGRAVNKTRHRDPGILAGSGLSSESTISGAGGRSGGIYFRRTLYDAQITIL